MAFITLNKFKIYNTTDTYLNKEIKIIKRYIKKCLKLENVKNARFNIIIVGSGEIKRLNKQYRNIDKETDVISFALEDEKNEHFNSKKRELGDIYVCLDVAISQAKRYNHFLKRELSFLSVHGLLHLLGYDHMNKEDEKEMFEKQELILGARKEEY